jgi:hypothetical protein
VEVTFTVLERFSGPSAKTIVVSTGFGGGLCGYDAPSVNAMAFSTSVWRSLPAD